MMLKYLQKYDPGELLVRYKIPLVYLLSLAYVAMNAYLIARDMYWTLALPVLLVLLWFYLFRLDVVLLLIVALTPVAINVVEFELGAGLSIPTEPLLFGVLVIFVLKLFYHNDFDPKIWKHPLSVLVLVQLAWMLVTSITSDIPLVSFKYLLSRLWFVVPMFFMVIPLFKNVKNIRRFMWLYAIPFTGVIFYTIYQHYKLGFDEEAGHWVMNPFYNDHTVYGAILTLFIPVFTAFSFSREYSMTSRFFAFIVLLILLVALILSYTRAAWVSLVLAFAIYLIVLFRIRFKWIATGFIILGFIFYLFQNEIFDVLEKNKQGTSGNFIEHVQSISNISTDASNLERINRWQSAIRMYEDRPVFGFGPGTYQFEYAPFQLSQEKTAISTNAGDRGNAHSEYIGPLSEMGMPGMLIVIAIVIGLVVVGMKNYWKADTREVRMLSLAITLGLVTYFLHGLMNNFLDTDKASIPVWGFIAMLVSMNIYSLKLKGESKEKTG
jgi:putative inorganic carbon (hco3(-)) transporter